MLECVVNVSEGRREDRLDRASAAAAGGELLDLHTTTHHHRAVLTLVGAERPGAVAAAAVAALDLRTHDGVHPRLGVVDVVPFVPLGRRDHGRRRQRPGRLRAVGRPTTWTCRASSTATERTLPQVRREAWRTLVPDTGPAAPHPTAGAMCVGARPPLVAYNVWLAEPDLDAGPPHRRRHPRPAPAGAGPGRGPAGRRSA